MGSAHPAKIFEVCEIKFSVCAKSVFGWAEPIREKILGAATIYILQNFFFYFLYFIVVEAIKSSTPHDGEYV